MRCEELSDDLAAAADGSVLLGRTERRHVERCLRCQAEMVQYRKVLRAMRAMRTEVLEPAPGPAVRHPRQPRGGRRAPGDPLDDPGPPGRLPRRAAPPPPARRAPPAAGRSTPAAARRARAPAVLDA